MRILYLAQHQRFSGDHAGFVHVYNFTRHLVKQGHHVTLAMKPPEEGARPPVPPEGMDLKLVDWELEYPLPFGPFPRLRKQLDVLGPARALKWIRKIVREGRIEVMQERHEMRMDMSPISTRFLGIPSVLEVNSPFIEEAFPEGSVSFRSRNFFRKLGFDGASAIVVQTGLLKKIISKHTKTPIHVVPNGADPELFHPSVPTGKLGERLGLGKDVIGFAGAFHPWHGALDLLEAFSLIAPAHPELQLLMIGGGGEDLEKCRKMVHGKDLAGRVVFTGNVPYSELPVYLELASLLVAPFAPSKDSKRKAVFEKYGLWWCPLKLFEYMAMGKPVLASRVGVIDEYLEGSGILYPEGDVDGLARSMADLMADPELRAKLGREGRKKVEKVYNWDNVARKTAEIYHKLSS
jgi:glycosyltransferase involved in cell wall biosynthesis